MRTANNILEPVGKRLSGLLNAPCQGRGGGLNEELSLLLYLQLIEAAAGLFVLVISRHGNELFGARPRLESIDYIASAL